MFLITIITFCFRQTDRIINFDADKPQEGETIITGYLNQVSTYEANFSLCATLTCKLSKHLTHLDYHWQNMPVGRWSQQWSRLWAIHLRYTGTLFICINWQIIYKSRNILSTWNQLSTISRLVTRIRVRLSVSAHHLYSQSAYPILVPATPTSSAHTRRGSSFVRTVNKFRSLRTIESLCRRRQCRSCEASP